jgi:hypothetical protein
MLQPLHIDPALLAFFPPSKLASGSHITLPSSSVASSTPRIGVGYGGSGGPSNIGVGVGVGVGVSVGAGGNHGAIMSSTESLTPASIVPQGMIDPALFELERVVKTIRSGNTLPRFVDDSEGGVDNPSAKRARKDKSQPMTEGFNAAPATSAGESYAPGTLAEMEMADEQIDTSLPEGMLEDGTGLGEEFDPTIREIVKSLTQAQEVSLFSTLFG